jgi:glycosyltransferase involved in cell wall biosynthesis
MRCPTLSELPPPPPGKTGFPWTEESQQLSGHLPDGSEYPRISIVTPNYNYGRFIEETIRSVLLQGYPNLEYIIIDGNSTDNSLEIIRKYSSWIAYCISETDKGQSNAINKGFSQATGNIYGWLNSDDLLSPCALAEVGKFYKSKSNCHFMTGDGQYFTISDKGQETEEYYIRASSYSARDLLNFFHGRYLPQPSVFLSQDAFMRVQGLTESLAYAMDLDLWFRVRKIYALHYLPKCLSKLRQHKDTKTLKHNILAIQEIKTVLDKNLTTENSIMKLVIKTQSTLSYAKTLMRESSLEYSKGENLKAFRWLSKSVNSYPPIIFFPQTIKLVVKLIVSRFNPTLSR